MMSTSARRQAGAAESCAPPTQNTDTRSNSTNTLPTSQTAELQQTVGEWGAPHGEAWAHAIVLVLSCPALGRATFWDDSRVQGPDCTVSLPTAAFNFCFMFLTQSRTNHMVVEIIQACTPPYFQRSPLQEGGLDRSSAASPFSPAARGVARASSDQDCNITSIVPDAVA